MKSQVCSAVLLLLLLAIDPIASWESYELDLFDLVEELGLSNNFYDFLGVEKTAETNEIKKAYRKLSLVWHPDKSDDANAGEKFRQLVAVYEILKDEQRRARYDRVLVEGLPKWNQPMFYFRRAKKLRFWEIVTILTLIFTVGHYLVLWAMYFESSLTMNERSVEVRKRVEKKMKKSSKAKDVDQTLIDEEMARLIPVLEAPRFTDILPFKFANFLVAHQFFLPHLKRLPARLWSRGQPPSVEPDLAANEDDDLTTPIKSPVIRINDIVPEMATNRNAPAVTYLTSPDASVSSSLTNNQSADPRSSSSSRPWTDDDKQLLCRTIVRFPPGTPRRWERIAETIGRHVSQVTEMAKQIQNTVGSTNAAFQESHPSFASSTMIDQNIITERSPAESTSDWSQTDQQLLECALKTVPKDAPGADRWEQIARCIPGKSRDECLARYRHIVQLVRAKKTA